MRDKLTIDGVVHPLVRFFNLLPQRLREDIKCSFFSREKVVECRVKDPDNLRRLVIDDRLRFLVEQQGYRKPIDITGGEGKGTCKYTKRSVNMNEDILSLIIRRD